MGQFKENRTLWGQPPWQIDFIPEARPVPGEVDIGVIGGGFTGLAAAAYLRHLAPEKTVALLEAGRLGSAASGRTGGIVLPETAVGDLPGLGDVLGGFSRTLQELKIDCGLNLSGVWEIARSAGPFDSPISWEDSGTRRVVNEVPGGTIDPGKLLTGLARAAQRLGVLLQQTTPVRTVCFEEPIRLVLPHSELRARQVLFATNAQSLGLSGLAGRGQAKFTLAVATVPLKEDELEAIGLGQRKGFYALDSPYLWGRALADNGIVFGSGLVHVRDDGELAGINVRAGQSHELLERLERRIRRLHPALRLVKFTRRWGGPIFFPKAGRPFFARHPQSPCAIVLGGFSGQGVTLSVYLGCWAAEVMAGQRDLPDWGGLWS